MHIVKIDKLFSYLDRNLQVIIEWPLNHLSMQFIYFFQIYKLSSRFKHVKLFMKYLCFPLVWGCDPSLGFYKEEIRSGSKGDHQW